MNTSAVAPRWLATDLGGGRPLSTARRLTVFRLLIETGVREIELGSPAASPDDRDFLRLLIDRDRVPGEVTVTVRVPAEQALVQRVAGSLTGARRAVVHLGSDRFPPAGRDRDQTARMTEWLLEWAGRTGCDLVLQYPGDAPPGFESVAGRGRPFVVSLSTAGERALPHVLALRVGEISRRLSRRDRVCLSVRPDDERGTAVAAAELALLAGADRVEGRLLGGGSGGGVDLAVLALNLLGDGVDPGLDLALTPAVADQAPPAGFPLLTDAERRVAALAAGGYTNREISLRLYVTVSTVEQHLTNIYRKLGVTRRTDLAALPAVG